MYAVYWLFEPANLGDEHTAQTVLLVLVSWQLGYTYTT